jgi:hypothetical protein
MQGWSPDFIPRLTADALDGDMIDAITPVNGAEAIRLARELARQEGIFCGITGGATLAAALASWLDARAHGGTWLVRIEDVDTPRCVPGADTAILAQLAAFGLRPDEPPVWQSTRSALYEDALMRLIALDRAYPCGCTRADIAQALAAQGTARERHGELVYPGTCRDGLHGKPARAVRLRTDSASFNTLVNSRRWRKDDFYTKPVGRIGLCNVTVPVREVQK